MRIAFLFTVAAFSASALTDAQRVLSDAVEVSDEAAAMDADEELYDISHTAHQEEGELLADHIAELAKSNKLKVWDYSFKGADRSHSVYDAEAICEHEMIEIDDVPCHKVVCRGVMPEGAVCPSMRGGMVVHKCDGIMSWLVEEATRDEGHWSLLKELLNIQCQPKPNDVWQELYIVPVGDLENGFVLECRFTVVVISVIDDMDVTADEPVGEEPDTP